MTKKMNELSLNNLKPKFSRKKRKVVGRGNSSGHGTYSCRGQKGQKSRSGGKGGLKLKALRKIWKKVPKRGGFRSRQEKFKAINLEIIDKMFVEGQEIKPETLLEKGLIKDLRKKFKILGKKINKKFKISAYRFSKSAEIAIKESGGTFEKIVIKKKK